MVTVTGTRPDIMVASSKAYLSALKQLQNKSNPPYTLGLVVDLHEFASCFSCKCLICYIF